MKYRLGPAVWLILIVAFIESCTTTPPKLHTHYKTSLIRFLSVDENTVKTQETAEPTITVPLKVGFAFAPSLDYGEGFPEKERMNLMQEIASQFKDTGALSITYWTLIGAYFVKGEKNDTHTLMDGALFHIPSRKMLFRASGINHMKNTATPINLSEQAREDSLSSFQQASLDLTKNLKVNLYGFRKALRN